MNIPHVNLPNLKPRFRGVSHEIAFLVSIAAGTFLTFWAPAGRPRTGAIIFSVALSAMFLASTIYHRPNWKKYGVRRWLGRIDRAMIFFLIAGTFTPFGLGLTSGWVRFLLPLVWIYAIVAAALLFIPSKSKAPKWAIVLPYLILGWIGVLAWPAMYRQFGFAPLTLVAIGGALYTVGAIIYSRKRPNPRPLSFGYHEIFHALVIAAALCHFVAVAIVVA